MTYNTGNPVPSIDSRDFDDNAETLDTILNSDLLEATTRTGKVVDTLAGITEAAIEAAEAAVDDALSNEGISNLITSAAEDILSDNDSGGVLSHSSGVIPISTDKDLNVILGYDIEAEKIIGAGIESVSDALDSESTAKSSSDAIYPLLVDKDLNVILGYDIEAEKIIGSGVDSVSVLDVYLPSGIKPTTKAVNHLISYGQSLSIGSRGFPEISISQPYSNVTFSGGPRADDGVFTSAGALIENSDTAPLGETVCSGAANYACTLAAIESGIDPNSHVIFASAAGVGGQSITLLNKGSGYYNSKLLAHASSAHALNQDHGVHVVAWEQGEADVDARMTRSAYLSHLLTLQADSEIDIKAITGQKSPPFFITYQTSYGARVHKDIALAQLDAVKSSDRFYLSTPCYILPYYTDNVHLTNVGYKLLGAYIGRAYKQLVIDGRKPDYLEPVSASLKDNVVTVKFNVPKAPLVFDTKLMAATTDNGFCVKDGVGATLRITSMSTSEDSVIITLSSTPSGDVVVRYALDYVAPTITAAGCGSGNLRDSTGDVTTVNGVDYQLFHACPHFELTAYKLGE